jgi:hypothetical protein
MGRGLGYAVEQRSENNAMVLPSTAPKVATGKDVWMTEEKGNHGDKQRKVPEGRKEEKEIRGSGIGVRPCRVEVHDGGGKRTGLR